MYNTLEKRIKYAIDEFVESPSYIRYTTDKRPRCIYTFYNDYIQMWVTLYPRYSNSCYSVSSYKDFIDDILSTIKTKSVVKVVEELTTFMYNGHIISICDESDYCFNPSPLYAYNLFSAKIDVDNEQLYRTIHQNTEA